MLKDVPSLWPNYSSKYKNHSFVHVGQHVHKFHLMDNHVHTVYSLLNIHIHTFFLFLKYVIHEIERQHLHNIMLSTTGSILPDVYK